MVKEITGHFQAEDYSIGIVCAEFNEFITDQLLKGALKTLDRCNVDESDIVVYRVPGSFEIPAMVREIMEKDKHDGVIALGAVIRGETDHFDYVCSAVTSGLSRLNCRYDSPISFGVLTTDTVKQAIDRAGTKAGNKGSEAARSLVEIMTAMDSI